MSFVQSFIQIQECLTLMELYIFNEEYDSDLIPARISRIAFQVENRHRFRVIDWLIENRTHCTSVFQNIVYHMIPCLAFTEEIEEQLIIVLLGENDEFLIPGECLFTEEVSDMVYKMMAQEHLDAWRDGYFEPEDLDEHDLAWHNEVVEYAKKNGIALR